MALTDAESERHGPGPAGPLDGPAHRHDESSKSARAKALWGRLTDALPVCLLYTSDAADDLPCVDLGGRRILTKKKQHPNPLLEIIY